MEAQPIQSDIMNRCKGCIVGALIGDAWGAPLEFVQTVTASLVDAAMKMNGGGPLNVGPAQITDDGELTLCVLQGLANCKDGYDPDKICIEYGRWIQSRPFDIGATTRNALMHASSMSPHMSERVTKAAKDMSHSVSNGSTMKFSPTAVYCSFIKNTDELIKLVTTETNHMHHNKEVVDCNIAFALAIRVLIQGGTPQDAYNAQREYALKSSIKGWVEEMESGVFHPPNRSIGYVKIAYQQAFHHLKSGTGYVDALKAILVQGGDTDTNACIAGMLLGARDGFDALPEELKTKVLKADTKGPKPRPEFLRPGVVLDKNFEQLMANCAKLAI